MRVRAPRPSFQRGDAAAPRHGRARRAHPSRRGSAIAFCSISYTRFFMRVAFISASQAGFSWKSSGRMCTCGQARGGVSGEW